MALVKNVNSYVTAAEATTYFSDRLGSSNWTNASAGDKDAALITATGILDSKNWIGVAVSDSQSLAFPRIGTYFDPKVGAIVVLDEAAVPDRIIIATYELALNLLTNPDLLSEAGGVTDLSIGNISLNGITSASLVSSAVRRYIKPLLINAGANIWWRAN